MTTSWMMTTLARENDTSTAITPDDSSSWRPLAIALPVCLVGIPLVTVLVIVLITCYRSKFKHKENSIFGRKLNGDNRGQNEAAEIENETGGNRTENPASHTSVYANLSETVEEARRKEAMGNNASSNSSTSSGNSGGNGLLKGIHWPPTVLWKKRQVSITENAEAEKATTTTNGINHKDKRKEKVEMEKEEARTMDIEAKSSGTGVDRTHGETTAETAGTGNLLKVNGLTVGKYGVPMRQKKETMTMQNQSTDNVATCTTTTTMPVTAKPSQTDNRKTFVVMYPMESDETNHHLPLAVNDVIFFMDEEKDGWMKGEKKESGEVGWFPRTYVREGMSPLVKRHSMHAKTDASSSFETNDKTTATTTTSARATMATMMMTTTTQQCDNDNGNDNDNDNDAFEDFDDDDDDDETGIEYQALYPYRATEDGDINFDAGDVIVVVEKQDNGWWYGYHGDDHGFFPGSYVQISRTDELSQTLSHPSKQATGDPGPAAGDAAAGHLDDDDPEMLLTLAEEDEDDDHDVDTPDQQKQNTKKKLSSARKSLGVFLMSLPHRITSVSNHRPSGNNDVTTGQAGSPDVTSDPTTTDPIKTKKSDRIVIPVKKKANKMKNKIKTKNDRNRGPMARRSSLAPSPPQSGPPQGAVAGALAKGVMSGLAQKFAAEAAKHRHDDDDDQMNTTYEEIGTTELFNHNTRTAEFNLSDSNEIPFYEIVEPPNNRDVNVSDGRRRSLTSASAAASHIFDTKRNDVDSTLATTYSNLDSVVQSTASAAKESSQRKGQETKRTENNKLHREDKNKGQLEAKHKEQLKLALMSTDRSRPSSSRKPVPPLKPSYIGSSTPNIAELLKAIDSRTDARVGKSPGNKPKTLAKPGRNIPRGGRRSDLGLTGTDLSMVLPLSLQKPKPLTEKPRYLSPGFPHGGLQQAPKPDQQMQRRDIYRSLDSIMVAAEAESDDDEGAGELEIMKWLRRKQSLEEELTGRGVELLGGGDGGSKLQTGAGKESLQIEMGKTKDISDGTKQNVEPIDEARIALMFEGLSKAGLNEESFV